MNQSFSPEIERLLQDLQSSDDADIRKAAAEALGKMGNKDERIIQALNLALTDAESILVQHAAYDALRKLGIKIASSEQIAPPEPNDHALLTQIFETQRKQDAILTEIKEKVGCLYTFLIVNIVIGVLVFLFNFFR